MFEKDQTLYMQDGTAVAFDHIHNGVAYVHPILTTIIQVSNHRGDDFYEDEDEAPAAHLIPVDPAKLYTKKPVQALDDEIIAKRAELAEYENLIRNAKHSLRKETLQAQTELTAAKAELDRWFKEHDIFVDLGRMLDNAPMFPLKVEKNPYHNHTDVPFIPNWKDVSTLTIRYNYLNKSNPWSIQSKHSTESYYQVRFFHTEEDRQAFVSSRFVEVCDVFRKRPDYGMEGKTYSSRLDFGTLIRWTEKHPHLIMPEDILAAKKAEDAAALEAQKEVLRKRLAALEGADV